MDSTIVANLITTNGDRTVTGNRGCLTSTESRRLKPTFFGQTRYSLYIPDSGAWRASSAGGQGIGEYQDYLYAPERLEFRDKIFTEFTVPALADAAEKHDVWHIVSYSESLPEKYVESLKRTADKFPFLVLQELADGVGDWGPSERIIKEKMASGGVFGRYRLDDDDVLSKHYFDLVERFVKPEYVGMVVSLPRGIEAIYSNGHYFNFREAHVPMNSMGMLYVSELSEQGTIRAPRAGAHDKADRLAPVIMDASEIGYLRTNHGGQDNLLRHQAEIVSDRLVTNMDKFPAVPSTDLIRKNFPSVAPKVLSDEKVVEKHGTWLLGDGVQISIDGNSSGITVTLSGDAPKGIRKNPLALSLDLESPGGRGIRSGATLKGLATSINPGIGQFVYFDVKPGSFSASASAFLADGVRIRAAKIVPLVPEAREVRINSCVVDQEGDGVDFSDLSAVQAKAASLRARAKISTRHFGVRAWPNLKPILVSTLGVDRTNRLVEFLADKLKSI